MTTVSLTLDCLSFQQQEIQACLLLQRFCFSNCKYSYNVISTCGFQVVVTVHLFNRGRNWRIYYCTVWFSNYIYRQLREDVIRPILIEWCDVDLVTFNRTMIASRHDRPINLRTLTDFVDEIIERSPMCETVVEFGLMRWKRHWMSERRCTINGRLMSKWLTFRKDFRESGTSRFQSPPSFNVAFRFVQTVVTSFQIVF